MSKFKKICLLSAVFSFLAFSNCLAADGPFNAEFLKELRALRQTVETQQRKIDALEKRLVQQEAGVKTSIMPLAVPEDELDKRIDEHLEKKYPGVELMSGLEMGIGATMIVQATDNANADTDNPGKDVADASMSIDLTFLKRFEEYGQAFVHLEYGNGAGVEDELTVFSNVNRDADDSNKVQATEVWYEQYLKPVGIPFTVTFGKLDSTLYIDDNLYANDETTQFLGRIFRNSPAIEFPDNSGAIRLGVMPFEFMDLNFLALNGNADWEDTFDGMFYSGQLNFKPKLLKRGGNYRLLAWYNDQNHMEWLDTGKDKKAGYGFGISFDQEITDSIGAFARYGWQDPKVYLNSSSDFSLEHSYSLGVQLKGAAWKRPDDILALAFGQLMPSDDYKKADDTRRAKAESHLECYYNYKLNDHLSLTPDIQVVWAPYGKDAPAGSDTIVVGGLRGQVEF